MKKVVLIDGCRTPFLKAGSGFQDLMGYQLAQYAIQGLLSRNRINPKNIDRVILGNVIANIKTSNIAREAALMAGIPHTTPCNTVTQACISANRAISDAFIDISASRSHIIIAGGVDSSSDTPIGYKKSMRKKLFNAQKLKGIGDTLQFIFSLSPTDFLPDKPEIAEYTTGKTMGADCDVLAAAWKISREAQDQFAVRSHTLAAKAHQEGHLNEEVISVAFPPTFTPIKTDNIIRPETNYEAISKLKPVFDKKYGTLTAANSSQLTDGAAAVLIMSEEKSRELSLLPKAELIDFEFSGSDLQHELLLGPAYAISKLMFRHRLAISDIDVFELHEAFAGQVLANLAALESNDFAKEKLGFDAAVGKIPFEKLNTWGGSLSLGHPFGATGARLLTTAANRLIRENGKYAILAACAAGGHGHAMLIKRYSN